MSSPMLQTLCYMKDCAPKWLPKYPFVLDVISTFFRDLYRFKASSSPIQFPFLMGNVPCKLFDRPTPMMENLMPLSMYKDPEHAIMQYIHLRVCHMGFGK